MPRILLARFPCLELTRSIEPTSSSDDQKGARNGEKNPAAIALWNPLRLSTRHSQVCRLEFGLGVAWEKCGGHDDALEIEGVEPQSSGEWLRVRV